MVVKERSRGIFEISGRPVIFPFQIIDAVILGPEWDVLKILVPGATEEQVEKIQAEYEQAEDEILRQHLTDVLRTAFTSNDALFRRMKGAGKMSKMSEAVEFVFKEEIEEAAKNLVWAAG